MSKVQSKNAILFDVVNDAGPLRDALVDTIGEATTTEPGLMAGADKEKLDRIAAGATANATNSELRDRTTHTGEQAISTITGLVDALSGKATAADIATAVSNLVASSPAALDTLKELAGALGDDPNFAASTATAIGNRLRFDQEQTLSEIQKSRVLTALGLTTALTLLVSVGAVQTFTTPQQEQAQDNLGIKEKIAEIAFKGPSYITKEAAASRNLTAYDAVEIRRWSTGSRLAKASYVKVGSEPSHEMKFQDAAGNWFEFAEVEINLYQSGAVGGGAVNDTTAIQRAIDYAKGFGVEGKTRAILRGPNDQFLHYGILLDRAITIQGDPRGFTLLAGLGLTGPGIIVRTQHDGYDYYLSAGAPPCRVTLDGIIIKHLDKNDLPGRNIAHGLSLENAATNSVYCDFEAKNIEMFSPPGDGLVATDFRGFVLIDGWYGDGAYRRNWSITACYDWRFRNVDLLYAGSDGALFSGCAGFHGDGFKSYTNVKAGIRIFGDSDIGRNTMLNTCVDTNGEEGIVFAETSPNAPWLFMGGNIGNNSRSAANTFDDIRVEGGAHNLIFGPGFCFDQTSVLTANSWSRYSLYFVPSTSGTGLCRLLGAVVSAGDPTVSAFNFTNDASRIIGASAIDTHYGKLFSTGSSTGFRVADPSNNTVFVENNIGGLYSSSRARYIFDISAGYTKWNDQFALMPGPFADDTAAAAGGVPSLGLYRKTDGTVRWRA